MFKIKGELLQQVVGGLTKGAKRARLGESRVFVSSTVANEVVFYFVGDDLQVEKKVECEVIAPFAFATSVHELDIKVSALPDDEIITAEVETENERLFLKWGRSSKISMDTIPETAPLIDMPSIVESVQWSPGKVQLMSRTIPSFTALEGNSSAQRFPTLRGLFMTKEDTGIVNVRASNGARAVTYRVPGIDWFGDFTASIPSETILGLAEILSSDGDVKVSLNAAKTLLVFECGHTRAISRILVGEFPDIDSKFANEKGTSTLWRVDRLELLSTARRIKRLAVKESIMVFRKEGTKAFVELPGVLIEQIGAMIEGDDLEFTVHSDHLEFCLSLYRSDEVVLCLDGNDKPLTILNEGNDDIKSLIAQYAKQ
ncbi:hypothetical protein MHH81_20745 [Psychrobacillus sp. FSL H8-0484]|uniref:hypothetical protein n=1 Tax=Psychrobacillus sp. FSL H8-0484 TaxID=2921390 RepID=UPI0030F8EC25